MGDRFLYSVQTEAAIAINQRFYRANGRVIHYACCSERFSYDPGPRSSPSHIYRAYSAVVTTGSKTAAFNEHVKNLLQGASIRCAAGQCPAAAYETVKRYIKTVQPSDFRPWLFVICRKTVQRKGKLNSPDPFMMPTMRSPEWVITGLLGSKCEIIPLPANLQLEADLAFPASA